MNRLHLALVSAFIVAIPALANAEGFGRGNHHAAPARSGGSSRHSAHPAGRHYAYAPATPRYDDHRGGYGGGGRLYVHPRGYWGWGIHPWGYYGYGYYPYVGGPVVPVAAAPAPQAITASVFLGGMVSRADSPGHGALDLKLAVDGKRLGFDLDALTLPSSDPTDTFDITAMPMVKGDLTYSLVSDLHARVRVEAGVEGIGAPGVTYVGPDVGASGQIALFGPLEIEGSAHLMPVPAYVWDLQAAVGLNFGALALRGGWRWVRLDDSNKCSDVGLSCGVDTFSGPTVSIGVVF